MRMLRRQIEERLSAVIGGDVRCREPRRVDGTTRVDAAIVRTPDDGWKCESLNLVARDVTLEAAAP